MRVVPARQALLLAAVVGGAMPPPAAHADELVVMPYACSVTAGRPTLRPAQQQGHRVIGPRAERVFRACSPANPGFCRQWTVHRFEFDCGGAAVPWIAAVAAAEESRGDVWLQDGRMHLRMPLDWNMAADDPCAQPPGERWGQRRLSRYCAERSAIIPPPVVAFPPAFAPAFGLDPVFVPAPVAQGQARPPDQVAGAVARSADPPAVKPPETGPKVAAAKEPAPPPPKKAAESTDAAGLKPPEPGPKVAAAKEPPPPPKKAADSGEQAAPTPPPAGAAADRSQPVTPKIINRDWASQSTGTPADPKAAPSPAAPSPAAPSKPIAGQTDAGPRAFAEPRIKADAGVVTGSTSKATPGAEPSAPPSASLANAPSISVTTISIGLGLLVLSAGLIVVMARRREHAELAAMTSRDIASVALGSKADRGALTVVPPAAGGRAVRPSTEATLVAAGRMPQTRDEALQVLGMGVSGDTGPTAIKKVVDGLRMSWHPDYAVDHKDREARELRLKQINAAWQILGGNRAA